MAALFADVASRRLFVEGLVEILSMVFSIENEEQRALLENELKELSDEELIRKQKLVEDYADTIMKLKKDHLVKVQMVGNDFSEKEERANISLNLNFS